MTENSLAEFAEENKPFAYIIAEQNDDEDLPNIDLRQYEDTLTKKHARDLIRELAYWFMYRVKNDKGLLHAPGEAFDRIHLEYDWLLEKTGWQYSTPNMTERHAEMIAKRVWDETFDSRVKYAALRFRDRMLQIDRVMPVVERAILLGDMSAIDKFVALARLDMDASGYKAPTRYEFAASADDELTEAMKQQASKAVEEARQFEDELLLGGGNITEGRFEEIDEEE